MEEVSSTIATLEFVPDDVVKVAQFQVTAIQPGNNFIAVAHATIGLSIGPGVWRTEQRSKSRGKVDQPGVVKRAC